MVQSFRAGNADDNDTMWINAMLQTGDHSDGANYIQNFKSQVRTKVMLLLKLATVAGYQSKLGEQFVTQRVPSASLIPSRIQLILKATARWPRILTSIKDHVATLSAPGQSYSLDVPPVHYSDAQAAHFREVRLLLGARTNIRKSAYYTAEANLQLMGFMLHWHSTVSPFFLHWLSLY